MVVPNGLGANEESFLIKTGALEQIKDIIIAVDNQDRLTYLNKAAAKQYNIDKTKALGLKLTQLYRQLWFGPEDEHKALLSLKEKSYWEGINIQQQPDGTKKVVEAIVNVIKDQGGNKIGLLSVVRDITNRTNVEKWLFESNQRLKYVVEASSMMVYEIDLKTSHITIIRGVEELLGYQIGEVPSTIEWWINQIHPDDKSKTNEQFYPTKSVDKLVNEYRIRHKDGYYIFVQGIAKVLKDTEENPQRIIVSMQNITQRKNLEMQLQEKERLAAIGATAGMVGHDIGNPLQAIIGDLYLLKEAVEDMPSQEEKQYLRQIIDGIGDNANYINKIVSDLQDYARKTAPKIEEIDLNKVVQKIFLATDFPKNISASYFVKPNTKLKTDATYIRRILTNLITNAIQAMPNGGELTIDAACKDDKAVHIIVTDTGKGIPKEVQDKLFTPLFTTKSKGQGFGLVVVKKFVEELGGTIRFESEDSKGTKFVILLPAQKS